MAEAIVATYSIAACDLAAGQWGVAVQSKFLAVGVGRSLGRAARRCDRNAGLRESALRARTGSRSFVTGCRRRTSSTG